jgi:hypothetical protein
MRVIIPSIYSLHFVHVLCFFESTAILIIIEGHETASNSFQYQFTTGKPLKNLKLTSSYCENGCAYTALTQTDDSTIWWIAFCVLCMHPRLQASGFRLQASGFRLQASVMGLFYIRVDVKALVTGSITPCN